MRALKSTMLLSLFGLLGCATSDFHSTENDAFRGNRTLSAEESGPPWFENLTAENLKSWDCQNYLSAFAPSTFTNEAVSKLNLSEFSIKTAIDGYPEEFGIRLDQLASGDISYPKLKVWEDYPWTAQLALFPASQKVFRDHMIDSITKSDIHSATDWYFRLFAENGKADWSKEAKRIESFRLKRASGRVPTVSLLALCGSQLPLRDIWSCFSSLRQILSDMRPTSGPLMISMVRQFKSFLTDSTNYPVLLGINRDLQEITERLARSPDIPLETDLFSIVEKNYLRNGFDEKAAYDRAWEFIGLYSTGGSGFGKRAKAILETALFSYRIPDLLNLFSASVASLDSQLFFAGKPLFSMPKNVQTAVNNGKPYHFWMSAYLARKNVLLGRSENGAATATWLSQLGYQMMSRSIGREPTRAFTTPAFGVANNKIRLDLAYASNGALFGARSAKSLSQTPYSVDETLRFLLRSGENLPAIDTEKASGMVSSNPVAFWNRWTRIFAPKSTFDFVRTSKSVDQASGGGKVR
jgi:hypothetical protein